MNNLDYILEQIHSGTLFKHWERDYSIFFCTSWGEAHRDIANSSEYGEGTLKLLLNPYANRVSKYYRLWENNEKYLAILAERFITQPGFVDGILSRYSEYSEKIFEIFEEIKSRESFDSEFVRRWARAVSLLVGHQILIMHRTDSYERLLGGHPEIIEKIYNARKKYESAFGLGETHFEVMCQKIIATCTDISLRQLKLLSADELASFLDTGILPTNLAERAELVVVSHIPATEMYVDAEAREIVEAIRVNEFSHEKQAMAETVITGRTVYGTGTIEGECEVITDYDKMSTFTDGKILVSPSTLPKFNHIYLKAKAIVTDEGGALAHASVFCREAQIPGIVGTKVASSKLKTGDMVSLDLDKGIISYKKK